MSGTCQKLFSVNNQEWLKAVNETLCTFFHQLWFDRSSWNGNNGEYHVWLQLQRWFLELQEMQQNTFGTCWRVSVCTRICFVYNRKSFDAFKLFVLVSNAHKKQGCASLFFNFLYPIQSAKQGKSVWNHFTSCNDTTSFTSCNDTNQSLFLKLIPAYYLPLKNLNLCVDSHVLIGFFSCSPSEMHVNMFSFYISLKKQYLLTAVCLRLSS